MTFTCRAPDPLEVMAARTRAKEWYRAWRESWYPFDDGSVQISEEFAQTLHVWEAMQQGPDEDRYSVDELLQFLRRMPGAALQAIDWVGELCGGPEGND